MYIADESVRERVLKHGQREMPIQERPFLAWANQWACSEANLIATLRQMKSEGAISRVGPVFSPNQVGSSCLAAFAVPEHEVPAMAALVNAHPGVNHNYWREHLFNVWFVMHASDESQRELALDQLQAQIPYPLIRLPLQHAFHIDLGFDLHTGARCLDQRLPEQKKLIMSAQERQWLDALQVGLPLVAKPYEQIAAQTGGSSAQLMQTVQAWLTQGVIKRVGAVVMHRHHGFSANAMVVFDVPESQVDDIGHWLKRQDGVHLCYQRARHLPHWHYNLFCMVHGKVRAETSDKVNAIRQSPTMSAWDSAVLFSTQEFKQQGAINHWRIAHASG